MALDSLVTRLAQSDEIGQVVSRDVVPAECPAWSDVMHIQLRPLLSQPARLAAIAVTLAGAACLRFPVGAVLAKRHAVNVTGMRFRVLADEGVPAFRRAEYLSLLLLPRIASGDDERRPAVTADTVDFRLHEPWARLASDGCTQLRARLSGFWDAATSIASERAISAVAATAPYLWSSSPGLAGMYSDRLPTTFTRALKRSLLSDVFASAGAIQRSIARQSRRAAIELATTDQARSHFTLAARSVETGPAECRLVEFPAHRAGVRDRLVVHLKGTFLRCRAGSVASTARPLHARFPRPQANYSRLAVV